MATNNAINEIGPKPSFFVYNSTDQLAVTGNYDWYYVQYNTVVKDTTSSFNTGTGLYTIPQTGSYFFLMGFRFVSVDVNNDMLVIASQAGTRFMRMIQVNPWNMCDNTGGLGSLELECSFSVPLTVGDTVNVGIYAQRIADNIGLLGYVNAGYRHTPWFTGYRVD
jgi:hypothetical protein